MLLPDSVVVVAVSGGPDSVCLLHALVRLRRLLRIRLVCAHVDHGLREGSDRDAAYVRAQAARMGVPFVLRRAAGRPARGESVEAWARTVRYEALAEVREEAGAAAVAVGHTRDDQAETVLLALIRGGGLEALAGMRPVSGAVVRPLLDVTREETAAFCRSLGLRPRHDPMNDDPAYLRVAIRTRVIPALEAAAGRGLRPALSRTAANLRADADLIEVFVERAADATIARDGPDGDVLLAADGLEALARPIAARVVRRALFAAGVLPEADHVDAVLDLAAKPPGRRRSLPGGLVARRERGYVRLFLGRHGHRSGSGG